MRGYGRNETEFEWTGNNELVTSVRIVRFLTFFQMIAGQAFPNNWRRDFPGQGKRALPQNESQT
jgi:hypothetical protein